LTWRFAIDPWDEVPLTADNWEKAHHALESNADGDGYADALWVRLAFGGAPAGLVDDLAVGFLLERFNRDFTPRPNSFERDPVDQNRWRRR
jgi:hypothetical protein